MVLGGTPVKEKALCRTTGVACLAAFCSVACKSCLFLGAVLCPQSTFPCREVPAGSMVCRDALGPILCPW